MIKFDEGTTRWTENEASFTPERAAAPTMSSTAEPAGLWGSPPPLAGIPRGGGGVGDATSKEAGFLLELRSHPDYRLLIAATLGGTLAEGLAALRKKDFPFLLKVADNRAAFTSEMGSFGRPPGAGLNRPTTAPAPHKPPEGRQAPNGTNGRSFPEQDLAEHSTERGRPQVQAARRPPPFAQPTPATSLADVMVEQMAGATAAGAGPQPLLAPRRRGCSRRELPPGAPCADGWRWDQHDAGWGGGGAARGGGAEAEREALTG